MTPQHRFVILHQGRPVHTAPDLCGVLAYLWGRDLEERYVVYDYERPVWADDANLTAWAQRHWPEDAP